MLKVWFVLDRPCMVVFQTPYGPVRHFTHASQNITNAFLLINKDVSVFVLVLTFHYHSFTAGALCMFIYLAVCMYIYIYPKTVHTLHIEGSASIFGTLNHAQRSQPHVGVS